MAAANTKQLKKSSNYVLSADFCLPSARVLRDAIQEISGEKYIITTKDNFAPAAIARYGGNARAINGDTDNNSIDRINLLSNKQRFSTLLLENGFYTPRFSTAAAVPPASAFPVIVRETLTSYGGRGIHVCRNMAEYTQAMRPGYFWTTFEPLASEYRIHVAGGKILRMFEKIREEGEEEESFPIRNSDRGYHFSLLDKPRCGKSIRELVAKIAEIPIMSTGFYALDLGWNADSKKVFVIEGNSAPGLNENTARLYAEYILGVKEEVKADEVLRPAAHNPGVATPATTNPARTEHKRPAVRSKWSW